jgi:hypothetical protein
MRDPRKPPHLSRIGRAWRRRMARLDRGLHRCPACQGTFVCPMEWETDGAEHWRIRLHCGDCDRWRDVRVTNAEARDFELELDRQTGQIVAALAHLDQESMRSELDRLVDALDHDLIDADDFAR